MLESNLEEEETFKSRKRKPSDLIFTSRSCSGRAFTYLHMLWDHAFVSIQFLTSICQLCNCGQASGLLYDGSGPFRSNLLPTCASQLRGFMFSEGVIKQTMPKHTTHSRKHVRKLVNLIYHLHHGQHLLSKDAAFLWKVKTRQIMFSWKSHSDSRCYFALY